MIKDSEQTLFETIKNECDIIFDIGAREDICYIETCVGKEFHIFEPNIFFFNSIRNKIESPDFVIKNKIHLNNFGLGNKTEIKEYYIGSQSFYQRDNFPYYNTSTQVFLFELRKFKEYIEEKNVEKIDFLKIDTEGYEADILLDDIGFVQKNVKYIQFEYAMNWAERKRTEKLKDIIDIFNSFDMYFLYDEVHPISKQKNKILTPLYEKEIIDMPLLEQVEEYVKNQYGLNIFMKKKN